MKLPAGLQISKLFKKWRLEEHLTLYLLAIAVGILGGYGAILFRLLIKVSQFILYQNGNDYLSFAHKIPFYLKVLIPALGGLVVGLIVRWGTEKARGHGVPELIEAVVIRGKDFLADGNGTGVCRGCYYRCRRLCGSRGADYTHRFLPGFCRGPGPALG